MTEELIEQDSDRLKRELAHDLKEELSNWARNRFWMVALLVGGLTFFGIKSVVKDVLEDDISSLRQETNNVIIEAKTAISLASSTTQQVKMSSLSVQDKIDDLSRRVSIFEKKIATIDEKAAELERVLAENRNQADFIAQKFSKISKENLSISKQIHEQFDSLESALLQIAKDKEQTSEFTTLVEKIQRSSEDLKDKISDNTNRAKYAKYRISVTGAKTRKYNQVIFEELSKVGLSPSYGVYEGIQNAVYIGPEIPVEFAILAIKLAKDNLPNLQYVGLYGDLNKYSLAVGGGGAPQIFKVSDGDIANLLSPNQTREELHSKLNSW